MVQLSHLYMTTGKTIALTIQTFVRKMMSLLFNTLSRLVIAFLPRSKCLLISRLQSPSAVILEPKNFKLDPKFIFESLLLVWSFLNEEKPTMNPKAKLSLAPEFSADVHCAGVLWYKGDGGEAATREQEMRQERAGITSISVLSCLFSYKVKGGKEGIIWEIGIDMYTLLYIQQITNKDLLYSTGNST